MKAARVQRPSVPSGARRAEPRGPEWGGSPSVASGTRGHDFGQVRVGSQAQSSSGPIQPMLGGVRNFFRRCMGGICGSRAAADEDSHELEERGAPRQEEAPQHPAERAMVDAWYDQILPAIRPARKRGPLDFGDLQHIRDNQRNWGLRTVDSGEAARREHENKGGHGDAYALDPGDLGAHHTNRQKQNAVTAYESRLRKSINLGMSNALSGKLRPNHVQEDLLKAFSTDGPRFSLVDMNTPIREQGYTGTLDKFGSRPFTQAKEGYLSLYPEDIRAKLPGSTSSRAPQPVRNEPLLDERKEQHRGLLDHDDLEEPDLR